MVQPDCCQRAPECALEMDTFAHAYAHRLQTHGVIWSHTRTCNVLDAFERLAGLYPHDPLVTLHLERLRQGAIDDLIVLANPRAVRFFRLTGFARQ